MFAGLAVTATENALMMSAFHDGTTTISLAAMEPHVMNLIDFLRTTGVDITIRPDHTIIVRGMPDIPSHAEATVIGDYIESGTFFILGALTAENSLLIRNARISDLTTFLAKAREA